MSKIDISAAHISLLKHIHSGGSVAVATYGKRTQTVEVICNPKSDGAGLKSISHLMELGLVRYGDSSPYKSGKSSPILLTEAGEAVLAGETL